MSIRHSKFYSLSGITLLVSLFTCPASMAQSNTTTANLPVSATTTSVTPSLTVAPNSTPSDSLVKLFADFGKAPKASNQGAELMPVSYSEKRGDATVFSLEVVGQAAVLKGQIGNTRGSQYSGVAIMLSHEKNAQPLNLADYKSVRVTLASPTVTSLRLRISSNDSKILNMGCYPIYTQAVTPEMKEYTIAIARFEPESFCGTNARTIANTIDKVAFIEVADIAHQRNKPTEISLGKIEFLK